MKIRDHRRGRDTIVVVDNGGRREREHRNGGSQGGERKFELGKRVAF